MSQIQPDHRSILLSFYDKGMRSKRSELIAEAALVTGLPEKIVKNWVGNQSRNRVRKTALTGCRDLSGYNLFCRDHIKKGDIKQAGEAWTALPAEVQLNYKERARAESSVGGGSEEGRLLRKKRLLKQLKTQVTLLEKEGMDVGVMINDPTDQTQAMVCTERVEPFMNRTMIGFTQIFEGEKPAITAKQDLMKKVQALFNQKYEEAGGKGRFPYKRRNIRVSGLPHTFKKPSAYGANQLREILDSSDAITVHIDEEAAPEVVEQNVFSMDQDSMDQDSMDQDSMDEDAGILDLSLPHQTGGPSLYILQTHSVHGDVGKCASTYCTGGAPSLYILQTHSVHGDVGKYASTYCTGGAPSLYILQTHSVHGDVGKYASTNYTGTPALQHYH